MGHVYAMLDLLWLVLTTVRAVVRPRQDLMLEKLLLRHQLAVLTRDAPLRGLSAAVSGTRYCTHAVAGLELCRVILHDVLVRAALRRTLHWRASSTAAPS